LSNGIFAFGASGKNENTFCNCPRGEIAEKYCGEILQGTLLSANHSGYSVFLLPR
jgi:hypothetical protein